MKIAVVGPTPYEEHPTEYGCVSEDEYRAVAWLGGNHSVSSTGHAIALSLRREGIEANALEPYDVSLWEHDVLLVNEFNVLKCLKEGAWDFSKPVVFYAHTPSVGALDPLWVKDNCAGMLFTRQEGLQEWEKRYGPGKYAHAPWAIPQWWETPPLKPNPFEPGTTNVLFAGRWFSQMGQRIEHAVKSCPELQFHVISDTLGPVSNVYRSQDGQEHQDLDKKFWRAYQRDSLLERWIAECPSSHIAATAREASDFYRRMSQYDNFNFVGSMIHGTFNNYLYYADVGLDCGLRSVEEAFKDKLVLNNCKVWDYLAFGLPVVADGKAGGFELIAESGQGKLIPQLLEQSELDTYVDAILECTATQYDRDKVINWMAKNHTYEATTSKWIPWFKSIIGYEVESAPV